MTTEVNNTGRAFIKATLSYLFDSLREAMIKLDTDEVSTMLDGQLRSRIYTESTQYFGECLERFLKAMERNKMIRTLKEGESVDVRDWHMPDDVFRSHDGERFYNYEGDLIVETGRTQSVKYNAGLLRDMISSVVKRMSGCSPVKFPRQILHTLLAVEKHCINPDAVADLYPKLRSVLLKHGEEKNEFYYDSEYYDLIRRMWSLVPETTSGYLLYSLPVFILQTLAEKVAARRGRQLLETDPLLKAPYSSAPELLQDMRQADFLSSIEDETLWDRIERGCKLYLVQKEAVAVV